jgi:hypothetical protein
MQLDAQTIEAVVANINAIAQHQTAVAAHHAGCVADAGRFKAALQKLTNESPQAVKQYVDGVEGINIVIEDNHVIGYYAHRSYGYVHDIGFGDYINFLASRRTKACDLSK